MTTDEIMWTQGKKKLSQFFFVVFIHLRIDGSLICDEYVVKFNFVTTWMMYGYKLDNVRHFFPTILNSIFTRDENNTLKIWCFFFHSCSTTITINLIKKIFLSNIGLCNSESKPVPIRSKIYDNYIIII